MEAIDSFTRDYHFLSNFYLCDIEHSGLVFPSVEHAYQAAKTFDIYQRARIRDAETPGKAKQLGKNVFLRPDWDMEKLSMMRAFVKQKFGKYPELAQKLLDTGEAELIEGNWWGDEFWGVCRGVGQNHLGIILMRIRTELRDEIRITKWILTNEDWYGTPADKKIEVSFIKLGNETLRVCVWGNDDFGLERDYPIAERLEALKLYESITDNTTQFQMKERGMYPA